jgi:hypothetical protein
MTRLCLVLCETCKKSNGDQPLSVSGDDTLQTNGKFLKESAVLYQLVCHI